MDTGCKSPNIERRSATSLQGGEPTLFKDFYRFVNEVKEEIKMDYLTNLILDVDRFIRNIPA